MSMNSDFASGNVVQIRLGFSYNNKEPFFIQGQRLLELLYFFQLIINIYSVPIFFYSLFFLRCNNK